MDKIARRKIRRTTMEKLFITTAVVLSFFLIFLAAPTIVYSRNPNLKVGKIEDKGGYFEAEITTNDGSLVDKLLVDKDTGRMRSVY
jgi:hypothetical protein